MEENVTNNLGSNIPLSATVSTLFYQKVIFCVIGMIGFAGNSLVIYVFMASKVQRHKITNILILNQSIIDLTASVFICLNKYFDDMSWISGPGTFATVFCKLWISQYFIWGTMVVSTFNLVVLTLERYLAIIYPMTYKRFFTKTAARIAIVLVWIVGMAFKSFEIWSTEMKGTVCSVWTKWPSLNFQRVFGSINIFIEFIIPICLMACCYGRIAYVINREAKMNATGLRNRNMRKARSNVIRTLLLVSICFFLCWVWNSINFLLYNVGYKGINFTSILYQCTVIVKFANCCINPFIYVISYDAFKKEIKQLFSCREMHQELIRPSSAHKSLSGTLSDEIVHNGLSLNSRPTIESNLTELSEYQETNHNGDMSNYSDKKENTKVFHRDRSEPSEGNTTYEMSRSGRSLNNAVSLKDVKVYDSDKKENNKPHHSDKTYNEQVHEHDKNNCKIFHIDNEQIYHEATLINSEDIVTHL